MSFISMDNRIGYYITSGFYGLAVSPAWILTTGFWDDSNIWADDQTWNDG